MNIPNHVENNMSQWGANMNKVMQRIYEVGREHEGFVRGEDDKITCSDFNGVVKGTHIFIQVFRDDKVFCRLAPQNPASQYLFDVFGEDVRTL